MKMANFAEVTTLPETNMSTSLLAANFLKHWVNACDQRRQTILRDWSNVPQFTAHVFSEKNPIIKAVAKAMKLKYYCSYYAIDAVLFKEEDRVPDAPSGTTWLRRIRIAFEHENYFKSGLFQEVSHLLITHCDLLVLVSYPDSDDDLKYQLEYLYRIIAGTDRANQISEASSFLFIIGSRDAQAAQWCGYAYGHNNWQKITA